MQVQESVQYDQRLKVTRVFEDIYLLNDADSGTGYLLLGRDRALVIDSCNGQQDYLAAIRSLTELPLWLVNTHAHGDHVGGNRYFPDTRLGEAELPWYRVPECPAAPLRDGEVLDLGGKTVEVIVSPGHTPGGICLLDREDRVLFTGDTVLGRTVWLFMENSMPIPVYRESLQRLSARSGQFDTLLTGHGTGADEPALIGRLLEACDVILAGEPRERFGTYEMFGQSKPCCYYEGEGGKPATLVYNPWLVRGDPVMTAVRICQLPDCKMVASQPGMWGDGKLEAFDSWMSAQPRGLYPQDFLAFDEAAMQFTWYYLYRDGLDVPDSLRVVDFPGGLYIYAAGIDGADSAAVKRALDAYLAAHPMFAYEDGRPALGHVITPPSVSAALGFSHMDYFFPIRLV